MVTPEFLIGATREHYNSFAARFLCQRAQHSGEVHVLAPPPPNTF
jgi:hypothetical protein